MILQTTIEYLLRELKQSWLHYETNKFNTSKYIDLSNHIRVLEKKNNIKVDVLVSQNASSDYLLDDSKILFASDVYVESIEDIIGKKIVYRRNDNLTRDIIDIAIAIKFQDGILQNMLDSGLINKLDLKELKTSLENLDKTTLRENYCSLLSLSARYALPLASHLHIKT